MNRAMAIGLGLSGLLHAGLFTATTWHGSGTSHRPQIVHQVRLQLETPPSVQALQSPLKEPADRVDQAVEMPTPEKAEPQPPALLAATEMAQETPPQRITERPADPPPRPPRKVRKPVKSVSPKPSKTPTPAKPAVTAAALPLAQAVAVQPMVDPQIQTHYLAAVLAKIQREKYYPRNARRRGEQGEALVRFVIRKDGILEGIVIDVSSGHRRLDEAAIKTLERASPVPPIPDPLRRNRWEVSVPIAFSLRD
jgi:protein TonB